MNKICIYLTGFCLIAICWKCTPDKDPFLQEGVDLYGKDLPATLNAYTNLVNGADKQQQKTPPAMYVDFSAGMYTAFGAPVIKALMTECFNTVLARQFTVYKLAQNAVTPLQVSSSTELGQLVNDPYQYRDVRAPIQAAVEQIVAAKNDALLITDFEEWQNNTEVTGTAYLKIAFSKWLSEGNSISFFIADYQEGKVAKHIYFTAFSYGRADGGSLISKLRPKLAALPAKFDLATDAYLLHTEYPGVKTGGIFRDLAGKTEKEQNILDLQPGYTQGKAFEYYPLGVNWETIADTKREYALQGQFHDLFRKLYIDLSNTDSYTGISLEVKTDDVTADFERYAKSIEAEKHRPKMVKGADGENRISDKETDPLARYCYHTDGTLKPEFSYEREAPQVINDAFVLNQTLFDNTARTDKKKAEIGIAFSPQFGTDKIPNPAGLIRVSVNIRAATVNTANPTLEKLKWINKNGVLNIGLYESVKSTLEELNPKDKTIYTYYLKTTE